MLQAVAPFFAEKEDPIRQRRGRRAIENALAVRTEAAERHADGEGHEGCRLRRIVLGLVGRQRRAVGTIHGTLSPVLGVAPGRRRQGA